MVGFVDLEVIKHPGSITIKTYISIETQKIDSAGFYHEQENFEG